LYAVDLTITAEKTMIVEGKSKAEAASKAVRKARSRNHLLEEGDFVVLCGTSRVRELKESRK
jgi:hypothetical protein